MTRPSRRTTRTGMGVLGAAATTVALVAVPAPAFAQPLPEGDNYQMYAAGTYRVEPLQNDGTSFLSSGALSLCGIRDVDTQKIYVEQSGDSITVEVRAGIQTSTRFTYDVCQGSQRESSTVTVAITRLADVSGVKKPGTRGKVVFTNRNRVAVQITYGSASRSRPDASRIVAAGRSITVATTRQAFYWAGFFADDGVLIDVGSDTIYKVQTRT